jgi:hypothetical protein
MTETTKDTNMASQKKILFCNHCKTETNHYCHSEHLRHRDMFDTFWVEERFRLWVCAGCENATLEITHDDAFVHGDKDLYTELFPKREEFDVRGKSFKTLPNKLNKIYRETIQAFNNGLKLLCAVGLRALIEGICDDKGIEGKNLEAKIDNLTSILPNNIVTNLHNFRFIGNTAIHELTPPENDTLRLAIEIVEDLLNFIYELDYKARGLAESGKSSPRKSG